jgi:hypothetical protein
MEHEQIFDETAGYMEHMQTFDEIPGYVDEGPDSAVSDQDVPVTRSSYGRMVALRLESLRAGIWPESPHPEQQRFERRVRGWAPLAPDPGFAE